MVKVPGKMLVCVSVAAYSMEHHERVSINALPHSESCFVITRIKVRSSYIGCLP